MRSTLVAIPSAFSVIVIVNQTAPFLDNFCIFGVPVFRNFIVGPEQMVWMCELFKICLNTLLFLNIGTPKNH